MRKNTMTLFERRNGFGITPKAPEVRYPRHECRGIACEPPLERSASCQLANGAEGDGREMASQETSESRSRNSLEITTRLVDLLVVNVLSTSTIVISPHEAKDLLEDHQVRVIDVREPSEFASGRIPRAELFPLGALEEISGEWKREQPLLLYCQGGKRSEQAYAKLTRQGFTHLFSLEGGFSAWSAAGFITEKSRNAPWSLERQVRFTVALFVITFTSLGLWVHPGFFALDFLISAGLIFSAVTNTCGMALVLTKLPWNRV